MVSKLPQLPRASLAAPARTSSSLPAERRTRLGQLREQLLVSTARVRAEAVVAASPFRETEGLQAASWIRRNREIGNVGRRNFPAREFEALEEPLTLVALILEVVGPANRMLDDERKAFPDLLRPSGDGRADLWQGPRTAVRG